MRKYKKVEVDWEDICTTSGWRESHKEATALPCKTMGYLIHKDKKYVKVAALLSEEYFGEITTIPIHNVKKMRTLK